MRAYADSSFAVSLYVGDANSLAAARTMGSLTEPLLITSYGELEIVNAVQLHVFRKTIPFPKSQASLLQFEDDLSLGMFQVYDLTDSMFRRANQLARQTTARHGTRTADLLHVAAALELRADSLFSFDARQRKLARAFGLNLN